LLAPFLCLSSFGFDGSAFALLARSIDWAEQCDASRLIAVLSRFGSHRFQVNNQLRNITGFANLNSTGNFFTIYSNPELRM
jgi:hypothetical protein